MGEDVADTSKMYDLDEVIVVEKYESKETRSTAPLQILNQKGLKTLNALQVSDAVKHFSGVTVKDYGGIGGLKTVSVRSLGSAHTAVSYDGITLSNSQTGQIDISRFSLENVDILSLNNGQSDQIFVPARQIASSSLLNIKTLTPTFTGKKVVNGSVSMKAGSFGLLNPSVYLEGKLTDKLSSTVSAEWMGAHGEYPYKLEYGEDASDSVSIEKRKNTDVKDLRVEANLYGKDSVQNGYIKAYYYQSERGLPGATIFYNTENFSSQRIWDRTFFAQGQYERVLSDSWMIQANAKYNYAFTRYLDPTTLNTAGKTEDIYHQHEVYASLAGLYKLKNGLSFSAATDAFLNTLESNVYDFAYPRRLTSLTSVSGKYVNEYVIATASALFTAVDENVRHGESARNHYRLSPYASISVKPILDSNFRIRVFYKNIFRMPTFNDLYYGQIGNTKLKPENTNQLNLGLTYQGAFGEHVPYVSFTADVYYNDVENKIVALPTKNLHTWTMLNYGSVEIAGFDLNGETTISFAKGYNLSVGASYTYNYAVNTTNPDDREYRHQIPYTPRLSGSGKASLETPYLTISYSVIWSGARYAVNQNYAENRLPGYSDHSISISEEYKLPLGVLTANIEVLNLANKNYAVVRFFPMPGRSFRATVGWKF